jgi:hypothetical protein
MIVLLRFTLLTNALAALLLALAYWLIPAVNQIKIVDLMFLTGVLFWLISTVVRISSKRYKKEWKRHDVTLTDPQLVMQTNNLAFRFLIAGILPIAGSIIVGTIYY